MKRVFLKLGVWVLCLAMIPALAWADDFADYKTAAGTTAEVNLPMVEGGWFIAVDYFPASATALIDGKFEAAGRMIAANNDKIYLQRTYGSSTWDVVATVPPGPMDPSFIHISPDGGKIALGIGYGAPLVIVPTSALSAANPQSVFDMPSAKIFPQINYYDADWADNRYLVINGGSWPTGCEPPYDSNPNCSFTSGLGVVDTEDEDPSSHVGTFLVGNIPGASADVHVDLNGHLLTGIGWATTPENRTGEIKVWANIDWQPASGAFAYQDYETTGAVIAANVLSAAYLGEDAEGNLLVGGGDAFGVGGSEENGYAAMIKAGVVSDIALGVRATPVNDGDKTDNAEYKYFAPDPCQDDSATGILAGDWGRGLAVMWNPTYYETHGVCYGGAGSAYDYWLPGVTPRLTIYYPGSAPDTDNDGIPDASDNAYLTANSGQQDTDGDGYGNVADADFNNDGAVNLADKFTLGQAFRQYDQNADMNSDSRVNLADKFLFGSRFGTQPPWY